MPLLHRRHTSRLFTVAAIDDSTISGGSIVDASIRSGKKAADGDAGELDALPHDGPDPFSRAWDIARAEVVRRALATLPAEQREVVELAYYGGLSQSEIATRTGRPLSTIKTRTRLAFDKLREVLKDREL